MLTKTYEDIKVKSKDLSGKYAQILHAICHIMTEVSKKEDVAFDLLEKYKKIKVNIKIFIAVEF